MSESKPRKSLEASLRMLASEINTDRYMLMEYLGPIVDGCRAAFNVSVEEARQLHSLSESQIDLHIDVSGDSYTTVAICFKTKDTDESFSLDFGKGYCRVYEECTEPEVVVLAPFETLLNILNPDSKFSPLEVLGDKLQILGNDPALVAEGIGILVFPILLNLARSGIDPSSVLSEDAGSVVMITASDLITKMIRKWIDLKLESSEA